MLWNAAIGRKLEKTDAVNILEAQSRVFDDLQSEGALEWEPEDEEGEGDEDEDDWGDEE